MALYKMCTGFLRCFMEVISPFCPHEVQKFGCLARRIKKGGKKGERKREGRSERGKTVVLFSLVWHYLSLLINPLRPSAWRSEEKGERK